MTRLGPNRLGIDITDSDGGILVISENWMPGWRAQCTLQREQSMRCGRAVAIGIEQFTPVRADLAFMAVAVPEGDLRFELAYEPDSVRTGAAITAASADRAGACCGGERGGAAGQGRR